MEDNAAAREAQIAESILRELSNPEPIEEVIPEPKAKVKEPELKIEDQDDDIEDVPEKEHTDTEKEALEKGWKPDGPKSAEEFLRAEPLYNEIKARGKEIKELKKTMNELMKLVSDQYKGGLKKELSSLEAARIEAIEQGDVNRVRNLDAEVERLNVNLKKEIVNQENEQGLHPLAVEFENKYRDKLTARDFEGQTFSGIAYMTDQLLANYDLDPEEHLQKVEQEVLQADALLTKYRPQLSGFSAATELAKEFIQTRYAQLIPRQELTAQRRAEIIEKEMLETFSNSLFSVESKTTQRPTIPSVEGGHITNVQKKSAKPTFKNLSSEQKSVAREMEKAGLLTVDEYINILVQKGEL